MKKRKKSFNRKDRIIGFTLLIICCFNFAAFFNFNPIKDDFMQDTTNEENTIIKTSSHPSDFSYYKEIVINHNLVEGTADLLDFPLLISIIDSDLKLHAKPTGEDIAFFDGLEQLDHEVERYIYDYSVDQAQLIAWVRIPELKCDEDTIILMHYGADGLGSQEHEEDVWNSDFKGVWHLSENPTSIIYDSTSNNINGNPNSGMTSADQVNGMIDGAIDFDGNSNDYIDFSSYYDTRNSITVSFWMNAGANRHMRLIDNYPDDGYFDSNPKGWSIRTESGGDITFCIGSDLYVREVTTSSPDPENPIYTAGVWVHVSCTYDGSIARVYVDGVEEANRGITYDITTNDEYLRFGKPRKISTSLTYVGVLDEVHISDIERTNEWITTEYRNQKNPNNYYTISEEFNATTDIGVKVGDKYIYEVVEKNTDTLDNDTLKDMREFVNATAWFVVLNETKDLGNYMLEDRLIGLDVYCTPIHFYFERNVYTSPYNGETYSVSKFLSDPMFFDPPYPPIKGISEWYSDTYNDPTDLVYGDLYNEGQANQYWVCKLIDGTTNLPGLVADNELGEGVIEFLELYDRAVNESSHGDDDLKNQMISEYDISNQGYGSGLITAWEKFGILVDYFRDYWCPIAMEMIWPLVKERKPQVEYMDVFEKVVASPEVKGDLTCSEITDIIETPEGWNVIIDKWNYTTNPDDFNNENISAINTIVVPVYKDASNLGINITVARMTLMEQDVVPIIVDLNLEYIDWWEDVIHDGNTIYEVVYSGPAEFEHIEYMGQNFTNVQLEEVNLTYSITYDNDGMVKSTGFYADTIYEELLNEPIRIVLYELSFYVEPTIPDIPGVPDGGDDNDDGFFKFKGIFDSRVIILLSISVIFGLAFLIIIKKPRGYRR
ncbi:MAG: LamG domain-containing protein [Promethearchaeota archaeon]